MRILGSILFATVMLAVFMVVGVCSILGYLLGDDDD